MEFGSCNASSFFIWEITEEEKVKLHYYMAVIITWLSFGCGRLQPVPAFLPFSSQILIVSAAYYISDEANIPAGAITQPIGTSA